MLLCIFLVVCSSTVRLTVLCLFLWASWSDFFVAWDVGGNVSVFQFDLWRCFSSWEGRPCGKTWPFRFCCLAQLLTCLHIRPPTSYFLKIHVFTSLFIYCDCAHVHNTPFDSISLLLLCCCRRRCCCVFVCYCCRFLAPFKHKISFCIKLQHQSQFS